MSANYRQERIERLLNELRYEIERGMMEGEIEEEIGFRFFVPTSKKIPGGCVRCEFRTKPSIDRYLHGDEYEPRLRVVK
jgi:hypothetical protein